MPDFQQGVSTVPPTVPAVQVQPSVTDGLPLVQAPASVPMPTEFQQVVPSVTPDASQVPTQPQAPVAPIPNDVIIAERRKAEEAERKAEFFRQLAEEKMRQPQLPQQPQENEIPDDYPIDAGTLRKMISQEREVLDKQRTTERMVQSEINARARFTDYDTVTQTYSKKVLEENPYLWEAVRKHPDPAGFAYQLAMLNDAYQKEYLSKKVTTAREQVINQIAQNSQMPPSLSSIPSTPSTVPATVDWSKVPREKWQEIYAAVVRGENINL